MEKIIIIREKSKQREKDFVIADPDGNILSFGKEINHS